MLPAWRSGLGLCTRCSATGTHLRPHQADRESSGLSLASLTWVLLWVVLLFRWSGLDFSLSFLVRARCCTVDDGVRFCITFGVLAVLACSMVVCHEGSCIHKRLFLTARTKIIVFVGRCCVNHEYVLCPVVLATPMEMTYLRLRALLSAAPSSL